MLFLFGRSNLIHVELYIRKYIDYYVDMVSFPNDNGYHMAINGCHMNTTWDKSFSSFYAQHEHHEICSDLIPVIEKMIF